MMPQTHATTPNAASAAPTQRIAPADVTNAMMPRVTSTAAATVRTTANGNRSAPTIAMMTSAAAANSANSAATRWLVAGVPVTICRRPARDYAWRSRPCAVSAHMTATAIVRMMMPQIG